MGFGYGAGLGASSRMGTCLGQVGTGGDTGWFVRSDTSNVREARESFTGVGRVSSRAGSGSHPGYDGAGDGAGHPIGFERAARSDSRKQRTRTGRCANCAGVQQVGS